MDYPPVFMESLLNEAHKHIVTVSIRSLFGYFAFSFHPNFESSFFLCCSTKPAMPQPHMMVLLKECEILQNKAVEANWNQGANCLTPSLIEGVGVDECLDNCKVLEAIVVACGGGIRRVKSDHSDIATMG